MSEDNSESNDASALNSKCSGLIPEALIKLIARQKSRQRWYGFGRGMRCFDNTDTLKAWAHADIHICTTSGSGLTQLPVANPVSKFTLRPL